MHTIDRTSSLPVWSDTLKPDTVDLATAVQCAGEVTETKTLEQEQENLTPDLAFTDLSEGTPRQRFFSNSMYGSAR